MKTSVKCLFISFIICCILLMDLYAKDILKPAPWKQRHTILFYTPAEEWHEALPVGNGRLGAMVYGKYPNEQIQMNADTIWAKNELLRQNTGGKKSYEKMRALCLKGDYKGADEIFLKEVKTGGGVSSYQTLGDLWITHVEALNEPMDKKKYVRELDLATGVVLTRIPVSGRNIITQRVFSSAIDDCIVVHLSATSSRGLNFDLSITRPANATESKVEISPDNTLVLSGWAQSKNSDIKGASFYSIVKVKTDKGRISKGQGLLEVRKAGEAFILIVCSTDYNRKDPATPLPAGWQKKAKSALEKVSRKSFKSVLKDSIKDLSSIMYRCDLDLGQSSKSQLKLSTWERINQFKDKKNDPNLIETYFQFGRYLLACSSRKGSLPANLQGLWAKDLQNPWNGDYHLNINMQMNYWPVDVCNLSECFEPVVFFLDKFRPEARIMAKNLGAKGFCSPHTQDPWFRATVSARRIKWCGSVVGSQWMVTHLMEHYRFTRDLKFLKEEAFPIIKENCEFILSWIEKDPVSGKLIGRVSSSPENSYKYKDAGGNEQKAEMGFATAYDLSIFWQGLIDYLEAAEILHIKDAFTKEVQTALKGLEEQSQQPRFQNGTAGSSFCASASLRDCRALSCRTWRTLG